MLQSSIVNRQSSIVTLHWLTQTRADVPLDDSWLSEGEKTALARMRFPKRRQDWRLGRWTAKRATRAYLGCKGELSELEIRAAQDGGPEALLDGEPVAISLSISHSEGLSLCALAAGKLPVGSDVEWVAPRGKTFAEDYFAEEEITSLSYLTAEERDLRATLIWSAKESALKALREGLRRDTRSVIVRLGREETRDDWNPLATHCVKTSRAFYGWWRTKGRHVLTLVAGLPGPRPVALE